VLEEVRPTDMGRFNAFVEVWRRIARVPPAAKTRLLKEITPGGLRQSLLKGITPGGLVQEITPRGKEITPGGLRHPPSHAHVSTRIMDADTRTCTHKCTNKEGNPARWGLSGLIP